MAEREGGGMKVGDRVCHVDGGVGVIEKIDDNEQWPNADVRWLTPDNKPSCCLSLCAQKSLIIVEKNVLPQPRSKAWKAKSKEFYDFIAWIISDVPEREGGGETNRRT